MNPFLTNGFTVATPRKTPRLIVGQEGRSDAGKTEWALSAPGPLIHLSVDPSWEGVLDRPKSKVIATRCPEIYSHYVVVPPEGGITKQTDYVGIYNEFYSWYKKALTIPQLKTLVVDQDTDLWELLRLAKLGQTTKIPEINYTDVNQQKRLINKLAADTSANLLSIDRVKKQYSKVERKKASGEIIITEAWTGEYERQGYPHREFLYQVEIRNMYDKAQGFGFEVLKCKYDASLVGNQYWGDECNFLTLALNVLPDTTPKDWGIAPTQWPKWVKEIYG